MSSPPDRYALLQSLRGRLTAGPADEAGISAELWDWTRPHRFSGQYHGALADMAARAAGRLTEEFRRFAGETAAAEFSQATEHYLCDLVQPTDADRLCWATFGGPAGPAAGAVVVDEGTARAWLRRLLGDTDETAETVQAEELSPLEQSLLLDIAGLFVHCLTLAHESFQQLSLCGNISVGAVPPALKTAEEWVRMEFVIRCGDEAAAGKATVLLRAADLDSLVGRTSPQAARMSADAQAAAMTEHLHGMPITLGAVLGGVRLTLEEVMTVAPDDVLLLDRVVGDPIDIEVEGRPLLSGRPARSAGKNAVVITAVNAHAQA